MEGLRIPAGSIYIGTGADKIEKLLCQTEWAGEWVAKGHFAREQPAHEVWVASLVIGRYPVTVGEYQIFIDAGGYGAVHFWTEDGWVWRQAGAVNRPAFWDDRKWSWDVRLPVVGVSWYEASAYCRWLSETTGRHYRLPTEAEWEKSARGERGCIYPWGDEFDPQKCNTRSGEKSRTVPVGFYSPVGDSAYGCCEMVGNVSEWVQSKFSPYPYRAEDGREGPEGPSERVTRGGSWHSPDSRARVSARGMNHPSFRDNDLGFRLALLD